MQQPKITKSFNPVTKVNKRTYLQQANLACKPNRINSKIDIHSPKELHAVCVLSIIFPK